MSNSRAPIRIDGKPRPEYFLIEEAIAFVDELGLVELMAPVVDREGGRPGTIPARAILVASAINGWGMQHRGHVAEVARTLHSLPGHYKRQLGIKEGSTSSLYKRVHAKWTAMKEIWAELLASADDVDGFDVHARFCQGKIDPTLPISHSLTVDGTDLETSARMRSTGDIEVDDDVYPDLEPVGSAGRRPAAILGMGPEGRPLYTLDPDARGGRRSATNSRSAGKFNGYELHPFSMTRDVKPIGVTDAHVGPRVPNWVVNFRLSAAGSHRSNTVVPGLIKTKIDGWDFGTLTWDKGYSYNKPETNVWPLARAGIQTYFWPHLHQRGLRHIAAGVISVDGNLFLDTLPPELGGPARTAGETPRTLAQPGRNISAAELVELQREYTLRAAYRWARHGGAPDADGYMRFLCPYHAKLLWDRQLGIKRSPTRAAPNIPLPKSRRRCCSGSITVSIFEIPWAQPVPAHTPAHTKVYGQRNVAERIHAALKGQFITLDRHYVRAFGLVARSYFLAFAMAGLNRQIAWAFHAMMAAAATSANRTPKTRAKRRKTTYATVLGPTPRASARGPST